MSKTAADSRMKKTIWQVANKIGLGALIGNQIRARVRPRNEAINSDPVFVYQMGRVGSVSIQTSLIDTYKQLSLDVPVFHGHYLDNFELIQSRAERDLANPSLLIAGLENHRKLRKSLVEDSSAPRLKVITLVRDIVARNVSTFFYALAEFVPDWEELLRNNSLTVEYLHKVYLSKNGYKMTAINWFEEQMEPVFGIDVYDTPFPKEAGYAIYSSSKADLLVMRLESLKECSAKAIREFLGLDNFELSRVNTGDERKTAELQRLFKTRPLPLEYVERMYSSRIARHFYTDAELSEFTMYWTGKKEAR